MTDDSISKGLRGTLRMICRDPACPIEAVAISFDQSTRGVRPILRRLWTVGELVRLKPYPDPSKGIDLPDCTAPDELHCPSCRQRLALEGFSAGEEIHGRK